MDNEITEDKKISEDETKEYNIKVKADIDVFSFLYLTVVSVCALVLSYSFIALLFGGGGIYDLLGLVVLIPLAVIVFIAWGIDKLTRSGVEEFVILKLKPSEYVNNYFVEADLSKENKVILRSAQKKVSKKLWRNRLFIYGPIIIFLLYTFRYELVFLL